MSDWKLIDTAPKDGTVILLADAGGDYVTAEWGIVTSGWPLGKPGWCMPRTGGVEAYTDEEVIFWQEIKEPPSVSADEVSIILDVHLPEESDLVDGKINPELMASYTEVMENIRRRL